MVDPKFIFAIAIIILGFEVLQFLRARQEANRNQLLIKDLIDANRHLALTTKAKDAIEAQTAIERDMEAIKKDEPLGSPPEQIEPPEIQRSFTAGGRRFSVFGYEDAEREFSKNVIEKNAFSAD